MFQVKCHVVIWFTQLARELVTSEFHNQHAVRNGGQKWNSNKNGFNVNSFNFWVNLFSTLFSTGNERPFFVNALQLVLFPFFDVFSSFSISFHVHRRRCVSISPYTSYEFVCEKPDTVHMGKLEWDLSPAILYKWINLFVRIGILCFSSVFIANKLLRRLQITRTPPDTCNLWTWIFQKI